MPLLYYIQTAVVGLAINFVIGIHMISRRREAFELRGIYLTLLLSNMLLLAMELLINVMTGQDAAYARASLPTVVCLFYIMNPVPEALWIFYLGAIIRRNEQTGFRKRTVLIIVLPIVANALLSLGSLSGGYLFYIDGANVYHRGELFLLMPAMCYIYLFYYIAFVVVKRKYVSRKEFLALLFAAFPPLLAGLLQSLFFGLSVLWIALAFSLLIVYVNLQSEQVYKELLALDRLKDQFLANTSHELRTPLNGIINMTSSILESGETDREKHRHNLQMVVAAARRLDHLIYDILDVTGMKNGEVKLRRRAADLRSIADSSLYIVSQLSQGKPIAFVNRIPDTAPPVWVDEERLYQIFYNLIGNALKFTQQGEIAVGARLKPSGSGQVEVWVEDTGIGMAKEQLQNIFKPFFQGDAVEKWETGGVGLGLSITRTLVELHGGTIEVASNPGRGSRFQFTLPVSKEQPELPYQSSLKREIRPVDSVSAPAPTEMRNSRTNSYSILAADDDPTNLSVLYQMLDHEGYEVTAVADGEAVLAELERRRNYDLIILDVMMPKVSGYEVLKRIREQFQPLDLPVLLLTARARPEDVQAGFAAGANDYVAKPFEAIVLKSRVRTLVELKRAVGSRVLAELSFLQAQIKPHFLFNALNVITALSTEDPPRARRLLYDLSDYLRGSFNFQQYDGVTSLTDEIQTVKAYVSIEMERFRERLSIDYEIDPDIEMEVPMLIIQPLVENAIRHGILRKAGGGRVKLSIHSDGDYAVIRIQDDGVGIAPERLSGLLEQQGQPAGIGLINIQRRLILHYGQGMCIQSVSDEGTTVQFRVPYKAKEKVYAAGPVA